MSASNPYAARTPRAARADSTVVPDRAADVIEWVAGDAGRAEEARAAEHARDKPRSTVLAYLDKVLDG